LSSIFGVKRTSSAAGLSSAMGVQDLVKLVAKTPGLYFIGFCIVRKYLAVYRKLLRFAMISETADSFSLPGELKMSHQQFCWAIVFVVWFLTYLSCSPLTLYQIYVEKVEKKVWRDESGFARRVKEGFANSTEAYTGFAIALMAAFFTSVPFARLTPICVLFMLSRMIFFIPSYLDLDIPKSACATMGTICTFLVFLSSVFPPGFDMVLGYQ